jgi:AcrR family transcriptional regulator
VDDVARDSGATKARIIEAAFREFAAHGLAGARIDRIAKNARANKRAIYDYFGDKQQLFDKTLVDTVTRGMKDIPRQWDDLPALAGHIYDYFSADPDRMRLHLWRQLERPEAMAGEIEAYRRSIDEMSAAQAAGSPWDPVELYALIWALHFTWSLAPPGLPPMRDGQLAPAHLTAARRAAIVNAVSKLVAV